MLDFARLKTPPKNGDVLVMPDPPDCVAAVRENAARLRDADAPVLGRTLGEWRRETRNRIAERDDRPIIVIGHQPAFIHPGVWAKHVVADRLARVLGGKAINLVVDSDSPPSAALRIPVVDQAGASLRTVRFPNPPPGQAYEQLPRLAPGEIDRLRGEVHKAMGEHFASSSMPAFFDGLIGAGDAADGVDQLIAGRRGAERPFGVELTDVRVSRAWWSPLLADLLLHADKFADAYNRALAWYRGAFRVRGSKRPIPDLARRGDEIELPIWAYRSNEPRRRLYVARRGQDRVLAAERESLATLTASDLRSCGDLAGLLAKRGGWRIRPRALALTIWARLFLADLFIPGIGGAKYDRISDRIIADYFGLAPPEMACASATLHVLPRNCAADAESAADVRRAIRDLTWNPQRHLPDKPTLDPLIEYRVAAVNRNRELRELDPLNHAARREVFRQIREINERLLAERPASRAELGERLQRASHRRDDDRIALDREYFFAIHDRPALEGLIEALPGPNGFRV
jgi:hypothetical protein